MEWEELDHANKFLLFPENIGPYLSTDETSLSQGELYTIITNKEAKGKKGALVAIIEGVKSEFFNNILRQLPSNKRNKVIEVTLDMAGSMERIVSKSFPKAQLVTDRFHVQKLAYDAVQELRISCRWEVIEQENNEISLAKEIGQKTC